MIQKHIDGILTYWGSGKLTTAYLEDSRHRDFSAVKRKARGFRNTDNMINMIYSSRANFRYEKDKASTENVEEPPRNSPGGHRMLSTRIQIMPAEL